MTAPLVESSPQPALLAEITQAVYFLHAQGWTPATSSNFSGRVALDSTDFWISVSGLDKGQLTPADFLPVNGAGQVTDPARATVNPSAETLLHALVYRLYPQTNTVLHCHSVNGTVLSKLYEQTAGLWLQDFEILKGFEGIKTHQTKLWLPIFPNSQNMAELAAQVEVELQRHQPVYGFMLAGHGLYAWGETPAQAKRHVEVFEFLFEAILKLRAYGYPDYSR